MYYKIPIKEGVSPLRINLIYRETADFPKTSKKDLALYFSFTNKTPS